MKTQITDLFGLNVYTDRAVYIGEVEDVVIDVNGKKIDSLAIGKLHSDFGDIKGYSGVKIPYRLIRSVGDIVLIRHITGAFQPVEEE